MPRETPFTFAYSSPAEALTALTKHITPVPTENTRLSDSTGRILAEPLLSDRPSPAVDLSSMDGYAPRLADVAARAETPPPPFTGEVRSGRGPPPLPARATLRIVTGGSIPAGADLVIKREDTTEHPDHITIAQTVRNKLK